MTSGYHLGRSAVDIAARILSGVPVERIPVELRSPNRHIYDHGVLARFGISESRLPPGPS